MHRHPLRWTVFSMTIDAPAAVSFNNIEEIFLSTQTELTRSLVEQAHRVTKQFFGDVISLYAPLYIANFCDNHCCYCGFQRHLKITRKKLNEEEIARECELLAKWGLQSVLILTGESRFHSSPEYIRQAAIIAKNFFSHIVIEVYALSAEEYHALHLAGVDGVTLYQETYNRERYDELHLSGPKKDFDYRLNAPERMAKAGIRQISLGVLLGLTKWQDDVALLFAHLRYLERKYPGVEYALSFPRIQKVVGDKYHYFTVTDADMLKIIATARILFPRVGINLSTRESADFRDIALKSGVTKISAGSTTSVGGYSAEHTESEQFPMRDNRSFDEVKTMLKQHGLDPIITDWRTIGND